MKIQKPGSKPSETITKLNMKSSEETLIYRKNNMMNDFIREALQRDFSDLISKDKVEDLLRDSQKDG